MAVESDLDHAATHRKDSAYVRRALFFDHRSGGAAADVAEEPRGTAGLGLYGVVHSAPRGGASGPVRTAVAQVADRVACRKLDGAAESRGGFRAVNSRGKFSATLTAKSSGQAVAVLYAGLVELSPTLSASPAMCSVRLRFDPRTHRLGYLLHQAAGNVGVLIAFWPRRPMNSLDHEPL